MKKTNLANTKLSLQKTKITGLNPNQLNIIRGGWATEDDDDDKSGGIERFSRRCD